MRSDVTLSTIVRVLERFLAKKENSDHDLLWSPEKAFTNKTCDFIMDSCSGQPLTVIDGVNRDQVHEECQNNQNCEECNVPLEPSLLKRIESRNEKLTTADFFQPTSLVKGNDDNKIYGFYYLLH